MKNKRIVIMCLISIISFIFSIIFFIYAFYQRNIYKEKYDNANILISEGHYNEAIEEFDSIAEYKDVNEKILYAKYLSAIKYYQEEDYLMSEKIFTELGDYLDSNRYLEQINMKKNEIIPLQESSYKIAFSHYENKEYAEALKLYKTISGYKDTDEFILECEKRLQRISHAHTLSAGIRNSIIITSNGNVITAGKNSNNQLSVETWENIVSVDIYGTLTIGLQENGIAKIAGNYDKTTDLTVWYDLIDVAAGEQFVVGLKSDGTVIATGHNGDGQINVENWINVIDIDAGSRFTVALTEEKELLFTGFCNNQIKDFEENKDEWKDVISISASGGEKGGRGRGHTVGLKSDGTLVAVGDNSFGQCDFSDTEKWSDIEKVATGDWYTVGLKSDGTVVMTGENLENCKYIDEEILNQYDNIVDIAAGYGQTLLLTNDGEVICFGLNDDGKRDDINGFKGAMIP